jgi:hypothetical protein
MAALKQFRIVIVCCFIQKQTRMSTASVSKFVSYQADERGMDMTGKGYCPFPFFL